MIIIRCTKQQIRTHANILDFTIIVHISHVIIISGALLIIRAGVNAFQLPITVHICLIRRKVNRIINRLGSSFHCNFAFIVLCSFFSLWQHVILCPKNSIRTNRHKIRIPSRLQLSLISRVKRNLTVMNITDRSVFWLHKRHKPLQTRHTHPNQHSNNHCRRNRNHTAAGHRPSCTEL